MTAHEFVGRVTHLAEPDLAKLSWTRSQRRVAEVRASCELAPVLFNLARISTAIVDFPKTVALTDPAGRVMGLSAVREDTKWRISGSPAALESCLAAKPEFHFKDTEAAALSALGVPPSRDAHEELMACLRWGDNLPAEFGSVLSKLHGHTIRAFVSFGDAAAEAASIPTRNWSDLVQRAWEEIELFPQVDFEELDGVPNMLVRLVDRGDIDTIKLLMEPDMVPSGRRAPDPGHHLAMAMPAAVSRSAAYD